MLNSITAERFAQGMTFDEYVDFIGTPENLQRAGSQGPRRDYRGFFRQAFEQARLNEDQKAALTWLVSWWWFRAFRRARATVGQAHVSAVGHQLSDVTS